VTSEDKVAARLKGVNCLIKFLDGEELLINVEDIEAGEDASLEWFVDVEKFLNGEQEYFPHQDLAIAHNTVKYVKKI
jgi:hypothetical protein